MTMVSGNQSNPFNMSITDLSILWGISAVGVLV
jgi:hypothetical protein